MFGQRRIELKTHDQIRVMRRAGLVVADVHDAVRTALDPGARTRELNDVAAAVLERAGAASNFLGYHGFPGVICVSVNDEVVHGIPGERVLAEGDVVSVDAGAIVDGWHADAAFTAVVGEADPTDRGLVDLTDAALWAGIAALARGGRLGVVGDAVEDVVASGDREFGIVREYVGHGIGTQMHQPPDVLNYRSGHRGVKIKPGLCVAIEPMISAGSGETEVLADDWTVVTTDGSRAAHAEHSVAVHENGVWVLTARDGGAAGLAPHGVSPVPLD
ncbi:type I methionyl aminopeptidase [Ruania halotolerans]|uniref:type I methionyl aminopeptidase n=1 Tax=Ruania halotolerans TaxID=2897773 RepID=UPI001E56EB33|nr:type I methionyl aminopeptidase [Ruania halotolerans]UFU05740.1 type I methionyl aminopeptidase [Ruania halotolerans]